MTTSRARWEDVATAFRNHIQHYAATGFGENAVTGLRAEGSVTLQYSGRVVYELLQNALDRAVNQVTVRLDRHGLLVGNDGRAVSVDPSFAYDRPVLGTKRSDFNALCALHTSNKDPEQQFGNKGIGFRSVFGVARSVTLWSRCADGGWWGLELSARSRPDKWDTCALPELDDLVRSLGPQPRPSFHLPRPLRRHDAPHPAAAPLETVVLLRLGERHRPQMKQEVEQLQRTRFQFVGTRTKVELDLNGVRKRTTDGWRIRVKSKDRALASLASEAGHEVKRPGIAVAWAAVGMAEPGLFCNYLPTRMTTGLPIDVHADFQVKADREGMSLQGESAVARYNRALLERAAQAHVDALIAAAAKPRCRHDLWRLATRPSGADSTWRKALFQALFPREETSLWRTLAQNFFARDRPEESYAEFWRASELWLEHRARCGAHTATWRRHATALCDALAKSGVRLLPVLRKQGLTASRLPSRQERGQRATQRVFSWPKRDDAVPKIPQPLLELGRSVTAFDIGRFTGPSGVVPFTAPEVLGDLRQVPLQHVGRLSGSLSAEEQGQLLRFTARLVGEVAPPHFAWRAFAETDRGQFYGRAIATLFLPTRGGRWEPARQLTVDRVDRLGLANVAGNEAAQTDFLTWLGVAPAGGVPIVEGGQTGLVQPRRSPPALVPAGEGRHGKLAPLLEDDTTIAAVLASLAGLPEDNDRCAAREIVATREWLPESLFRTRDELPSLASRVAPEQVVLAQRDPRSVFFPVPADADDLPRLRTLGALGALESEDAILRAGKLLSWLERRCPAPDALGASLGVRLAATVAALLKQLPLDPGARVPTLLEQHGRLRWRYRTEEAWVAHPADRQEIRRFFPEVPLVTATHRQGLAERIRCSEVTLSRTVVGDDHSGATPVARALLERLRPHTGALCAAAEQSRQTNVDPDRVRAAWMTGEPLQQARDVWVELRLVGPDRPPRPWRRHKHEDVFLAPGATKEEPGAILFDTRRAEGPPLRHFGRPLARLLVNNAALGPLFAEVLTAIEEGAVDDLLERRHLTELTAEWDRRISPLTSEQAAVLTAHLSSVCTDPAAVQRSGRLEACQVRVDSGLDTERAVREALRRGVDAQLAAHLPRVVIRAENERALQAWLRLRDKQLAAWLDHEGKPPATWGSQLLDPHAAGLGRVLFEPARYVEARVRDWGFECGDIEADLRSFAPRFTAVDREPIPLARSGWRSGLGGHGRTTGGPETRLETSQLLEEQVARAAWGDAAEQALLTWVVASTRRLLSEPGAYDALLSAFSRDSKTRARVAEALDGGDLPAALHIATMWSGAGFDIIGLEPGPGCVQPVRYECKGLPVAARTIRVHLSRRELAVARNVRRGDAVGSWRLVGVESDGNSVDLTAALEPVIAPGAAPLQDLHDCGLEPDGLRLVVVRT